MKYFKVTAKFGHVGKNKYYRGNLFIKAESKKEAAEMARYIPRVKHDHKDAILQVEEIDRQSFIIESERNRAIKYFSCYNIQQQREWFCEIEKDIFQENRTDCAKHSKKNHSLKKNYNDDPDYYCYKNKRKVDFYIA